MRYVADDDRGRSKGGSLDRLLARACVRASRSGRRGRPDRRLHVPARHDGRCGGDPRGTSRSRAWWALLLRDRPSAQFGGQVRMRRCRKPVRHSRHLSRLLPLSRLRRTRRAFDGLRERAPADRLVLRRADDSRLPRRAVTRDEHPGFGTRPPALGSLAAPPPLPARAGAAARRLPACWRSPLPSSG